MTDDGPQPKPASKLVGYLASMVIPLCVFGACLAVDLSASSRPADAGRTAHLALMAAVLQILVILAVAPWWSARLSGERAFGALIAALRVAAMTVSTTVLLLLLSWLQTQSAPLEFLKAQTVVLGVGLFVVGFSGVLRFVFRGATGAAVFTTLAGFLLTASPFWGNVLIQGAGESWKPWAIGFVVKATPISACASAVRYDLFREGEGMMYKLSAVSDYRYRLPAWWSYALIAGAAGILLIELASFIRTRQAAK
jgi:hypothetical protein